MDLMNMHLKYEHKVLLILLKSYFIYHLRYSLNIFFLDREEPDAVFLQEVIPTSLRLIQNFLPEYNSYAGKIKIFISFLN